MASTLVLDTETTGFMRKELPAHHASQPWVVQIGAQLFDDDTRRVVGEVNFIVDPRSVGGSLAGNEEAGKIHGITNEMIDAYGVSYKVGIAAFNNLLKRADTIVAHNMPFDFGILCSCYERMEVNTGPLKAPRSECTVKLTKNILKLPGKYKDFKWPNLMEAYTALVDPAGFDGAHDAMVDVRACAAVYWAVKDGGKLLA